MNDLISREEARGKFQTVTEWNGEVHRYIDEQGLDSIPSADILDHARAIKEYCKAREENEEGCDGCPFHFYLGFRGCCIFRFYPCYWNLPEGEKGGAEMRKGEA